MIRGDDALPDVAFGDRAGLDRGPVAVGDGLRALRGIEPEVGLAMLRVDTFWIANAIYLCFVLSALLGSIAKIGFYRGSFHP